MEKRIIGLAAVVFFWLALFPLQGKDLYDLPHIKRLTFSGNNKVLYPCLSNDGRRMLYVLETEVNDTITRAIRVMTLETGKEEELYRDGKNRAPAPLEDAPLLVGSKPPLLSGDGRLAIFSLSLDEPEHILDHYLAVIKTDGTGLQVISFPIVALEGKDTESLDFISSKWERISNYAVNHRGDRIACVLKGHLGPRRYGNPSGIILLDTSNNKQRTILSPDFADNKWEWPSFPCRPLTGGGWAFALSGNGEKLVFGAQSSEDKNDYDLYVTDWDGKEIKRITDFHDRWFSMADISHDGEKVVFYYAGKKEQGIGTYTLETADSTTKYLESKTAPRVEFTDMSGDGRLILFKHVYTGMMLDLRTGKEKVIFDENTPGYVSGIIPMDFPRTPAFWRPNIINREGDKVLLVGPPQGKQVPEIYLLRIDLKTQE